MLILARLSLILVSVFISEIRCLKWNVSLEITPKKAEVGQDVTLHCHYNLKSKAYMILWYHDQKEFFQYIPDDPSLMLKSYVDDILVDESKSNATQVTIQNVDFPQSGQYSCAVTTSLWFITRIGYSKLTVISVPKGKPVLTAEREDYNTGDVLRANCSVQTSRPVEVLSFTLNDLEVNRSAEKQNKKYHSIGLQVPLQSFHFENGTLRLRCTAKIDGFYNGTSEIILQKKVMSKNAVNKSYCFADLTIMSLLLLQQLFR